MIPRIARLRHRAWRSYHAPYDLPPLAVDPQDSPVLRWAKQLAHGFRHRPIAIADDEWLVGTPPHLCYGDEVPAPVSAGRQAWTPQPGVTLDEDTAAYYAHGMFEDGGNHTTADYREVFSIGFTGIITRIDARLARLQREEPEAREKADFLRALRIVAEGYIDLCHRYADLAEEQATSANATRAEELRTIAAHCRRVIAEPPRTFWEACQCLWFTFAFVPDAPGRVDVLLVDYYLRDLAQGIITHEQCQALISELWVKYFEWDGAAQAVAALHHLTLGGVTPDGRDASNELTDLCLDVTADLQLHRPQIALRWHAQMPPERLRHAVRCWRAGTGSPDLCNDEQIVNALTRVGVALEDARDFSLSGCQEVVVSGKAQMGSVEGFINLAKLLRIALGLEPELCRLPERPLNTFADFWAQLEGAMTQVALQVHHAAWARDKHFAESRFYLEASLVVQDCIERARDYAQGGARYNFCNWNMVGLANVVDALRVIQRLVFEERQVTLAELTAAMQANWQGFTALRERIRRLPAFGNDVDNVDALATRFVTRFDAILKQHTPFRGGRYILGTTAGAENMHIEFGRVTGATPDGRMAGETLADSAGAAQGRDKTGVTALLNSVAKLPHQLLPTATTLNVKLDPHLLDTETGVAQVADLIRAHFLTGGQHCQVNLVTREMLLAARACPAQHQHLIVRVAGYSAQFVSLWEDLQDEIIARTEHVV